MKKVLTLFLVVLMMFTVASLAFAADTLQYTVSSKSITADSSYMASFDITITDIEQPYHVADYELVLGSGLKLSDITVSFSSLPTGASIEPPRLAGDAVSRDDHVYFAVSGSSDIFPAEQDLTCTVNVYYSGDTETEITVQKVQRLKKGITTRVVSTQTQTIAIHPYEGGSPDADTLALTSNVKYPGSGTITRSPNQNRYEAGTTVTLTFDESNGYELDKWVIKTDDDGLDVPLTSGSSTSKTVSFVMPDQDVTADAYAGEDGSTWLWVTASAVPTKAGSFTFTDDTYRYLAGETVEITFKPASGYSLTKWTVQNADDDSNITLTSGTSTSSKISFVMPEADVVVSVSTTYDGNTYPGGTTTGGTTTTNNSNIGDTDTPLTTVNFTDLPDWAAEFINYLAERGFVTGRTSSTFAPNDPITRAEFITILARMSGETLPTSYSGAFTDVASGSYYEGAVAWGVQNGIVNGTSATTFTPNNRILRQEISAMIMRYAGYKSFTLPQTAAAIDFTDRTQIHSYATEAVSGMQLAGIISGYPDNSFRPLANATRAEAAKMLAVFHQLLNQ